MDILQPADSPSLRESGANVWVYRFTHPDAGWILSIATHAEPGSKKLSLGGFRIVARERIEAPGFDPDREAIGLAIGMEQRLHWSRVLLVGGPRARRETKRIVGGKCVVQPTDDGRVGGARDFALLDWAAECFAEMERESGVLLITGYDLGQGLMSDGKTDSLTYLASRFPGCVAADTSASVGEGNYNLLKGMLAAAGIQVQNATVGLVGVDKIGSHVGERLLKDGATILALGVDVGRRAELAASGAQIWEPDRKLEMLHEPMDAVVVNAGWSLDEEAIAACVSNPRLKVACGSEELAMKDSDGPSRLLAAKKIYCPTVMAGMMGYLTTVEQYLAVRDGLRFEIRQMLEASKRLEIIGRQASSLIRARNYGMDFEAAAEEIGRAGKGTGAAV